MKLPPLLAPTLLAVSAHLTAALTSPHYPHIYPRNASHVGSSHSAFVHSIVYGNFTFAVTGVKENGDLYFHIEAPAENSWVAVGTGSEMKGSLMWVVYRSEDEKGITLSPRTVNGNVEPSYDDRIDCSINSRDGVKNGIVPYNEQNIYAVNVYCKDINKTPLQKQKRDGADNQDKGGNLISFDNTEQSFIFALGPTDRHLHSDAKDANLRRHMMYGQFKIDLTRSMVEHSDDVAHDELSAVGTWENRNAQILGEPKRDRDWSGNLHSLIMCGVYVLLFPVGVVFLRLIEKVKWHAWMQGIGTGFALLGVGLGIWAALEYNQSKRFNHPHQLIGLFVVGATLLQLVLGTTHHLFWKKHQQPTLLGHIHLYLGPLVMIVGTANGFLGFHFAGGSYHNLMYGMIVGVFYSGLVGALFWARIRRKAKRRENMRIADEAYEEYKGEKRGPPGRLVERERDEEHDVELRDMRKEVPPAYVDDDHGKSVEPRALL